MSKKEWVKVEYSTKWVGVNSPNKYYKIQAKFENWLTVQFKTKKFVEKESPEETIKTILQEKYGNNHIITEFKYNNDFDFVKIT